MENQDDIRSLLDSLRLLVRELRLFSTHAQSAVGLTAAQLFVLESLARHAPLSINALADLTLTHQSTVSVVAQKLARRGLLARHEAPTDRRKKELTITPAGRKALRQAPASVQNRLIAAAAALPTKDRRTLAHLLRTLIQSLGVDASRPPLFFEPETRPTRRKPRPAKRKETH